MKLGRIVCGISLGAAGLLAVAGPDAPVRILGIVPLEQQDRVAFNTDQDDHYYVLRRGDTLAAIGNPVGLKVAPRGTNLLEAVRSSATTGFYTVERVPVASPVDSDGDGAHDLLELDFQPYRSPLTPADALLIPPAILDPLPEQTTNDTVTVSGRAWPGTVLTIAGGSSVVSGAVAQAGTYSFSVNLRPNRVNKLFLTSGLGPNASAPVALDVVQDREPPTLFVDFPSTGSVTIEPTTTLAGRVGDVLSGALGLSVTVNGQPAAVAIGLGQNGTFDKPSLPLALGTNTFTIVARDALGNQTTRTHTVVRKTPGAYRIERVSGDAQFSAVHTLVPQPLAVRVIDGNGQPFAGKLVDFQVTRSDGELLPGPSFNLPRTRAYQVRTDETGLARAWWLLGGTAGCAADRVEATSVGVDGKATFCATARPGPASQINIGSGNNQVAEVGAPAPQTLRAWVNDSCNGIVNLPVTFTVTEGNGAVNGQSSVTVNTGPTGHAEVQFRLATDGTRNAVEATFADNPGLPATFTATGRIRNALQPTVFRGLVLDNANQPLGGAQVWAYVNGQAFPTANTDAQGFFELTDLPAGAGSLFVDGAFASQLNGQSIPLGSFPALSYEVVVTANTINELPTPVRLPRLDPANSVVFNNSQDVILRCAGIEGLELKVKAGSMRKADGSLVSPGNLAILSLNQVHADEIPMPMPNGIAPPFAWTLQPGGATFDPPVEITYPNMSGLSPGAIADILTYNHALEAFQIVATGQVSADGLSVVSDPGSGLSLAGWGTVAPPPPPSATVLRVSDACPPGVTAPPDPAPWWLTAGGVSEWTLALCQFTLRNIPVTDRRSLDGPATGPDGISDDWYRLLARQDRNGTSTYAYTTGFLLRPGQISEITDDMLAFSDQPPPTLERLRITVSPSVLTTLGQTVQATVLGTYSDGSTAPLEGPGKFTAWITSNPAIATVNSNGVVTAVGAGSAFITALNEAVATVHRIEVRPGVGTAVVEGYVRTADGQPAVGALVNVSAVPGDITSQTGGKFIFPSVPIDVTNLVVNATYASGGSNLFGTAMISGVLRRGTNDAGVVVVAAPTAPEGMALIPAGEFQMGDAFNEGSSDERPVHPVYVSAFYMDKYEVTKALWDEVHTWALANGYTFSNTGEGKAANHPVHTVDWYDCVKWCNARSEKAGLTPAYYTDTARTVVYRTGEINLGEVNVNWTGGGYRLPTEAEWEKAARGGLAGQRFPWGANITHAEANYDSSTSDAYDTSPTRGYHPTYASGGWPYTSPVGSFAANGYGLFDMAGNLWEWNWDWFDSSYYASPLGTDPHGPTSGSYRVLRGGSFYESAFGVRSATRPRRYHPSGEDYGDGFRCVR